MRGGMEGEKKRIQQGEIPKSKKYAEMTFYAKESDFL
jgi:hypothetical protein